MNVGINEASNNWVIIPDNNSPCARGDSSLSGVHSNNSRDVKKGEFCHVFRT